jgi:serine/threonine protein kinase
MLIRLDHPSIVNLYEVYEEGQLVILILEYMAGG